jgi:hypothetical protein
MTKTAIALMFTAACFGAQPAFAADDPPSGPSADVSNVSTGHIFVNASVVPDRGVQMTASARPATLSSMYATWIGLQAYDSYSTLAGVSKGAAETNPFVSGLTKNRAMFFTTKASMTVVTIAVAEQMWRDHHPGRAIVLMVVSNGVMAAVAARNASVLQGLK